MWVNQSLACTNYWYPLDLDPAHQRNASMVHCRDELNGKDVAAHVCVGNLTDKIEGDDSAHIMGAHLSEVFGRCAPVDASAAGVTVRLAHPTPPVPFALHRYFRKFCGAEDGWAGSLALSRGDLAAHCTRTAPGPPRVLPQLHRCVWGSCRGLPWHTHPDGCPDRAVPGDPKDQQRL
jgi:hypothetical protein